MKIVLERLSGEGLKINLSKSEFCVKKMKWLGHILSEDGLTIDTDRVTAIKNSFNIPQNKTNFRFLGIVNFAGRFIENKSTILDSLYNRPKNDVVYQ